MAQPLVDTPPNLAKGEALAETKWKADVDGLEGVDRTFTALMLENTQKYLSGEAGVGNTQLNETIRATNVGNFDRFAFPLVRAVYPNLIAQDLVSVQPMDGPVGMIFYFDILYGSTKGSAKAGTPVFSSLSGHPGTDTYSTSTVDTEVVATTTGDWDSSGGDGTATLSWTPVIPGTVTITDGTRVAVDDGNGGFTGDVLQGDINYSTGAIGAVTGFQFSGVVPSGSTVTASYEYDNEANSQVPEIDFQLTSSPVVAQVSKLRTRYSLEAAQNLRNLHGLSAETELVVALAQEIRFEIDRGIIKDVNAFAEAETVSWTLDPAASVSWTEHKLSFVDQLIRGSNNIFELTRRGSPNWVVMGLEVSTVVESLPGFQPSDQMSTPTGVIYAGTLNGRWRMYKDPYNIDGTADQKNFLIGYKGGTFLESGFVYAPYIPFYTTPTVVLDDFVARKGMATQYGKKKINGKFYCPGTVTDDFAV